LVGSKTLHAHELNDNDYKQCEEMQRIEARESGETKFCESSLFLIDIGVGKNEARDTPKNLNRKFTIDIARSQQAPQWLD
jgi:hypothetical protein